MFDTVLISHLPRKQCGEEALIEYIRGRETNVNKDADTGNRTVGRRTQTTSTRAKDPHRGAIDIKGNVKQFDNSLV